MSGNKKLAVLAYQYPKVLLRFPRLIRLIYWVNYATQLRKWYVMRVWQQLLKQAEPNAVVADFGAGEAQYLVPFCNEHAQKTFYALDNRISNVNFCEALGYTNLNASLLDIELNTFNLQADLGLCVGVMQYLEKDLLALTHMHQSLKPGATLLMYVPINGDLLTPFYKFVFKKYAHYESINQRKRVYQEHDLIEKLTEAGFWVKQKTYTYGFWGKLSHEWLNTCSTLIFSGPFAIKILALIFLIPSFSFILIFMALDYVSDKETGNGVLLELQKRGIR